MFDRHHGGVRRWNLFAVAHKEKDRSALKGGPLSHLRYPFSRAPVTDSRREDPSPYAAPTAELRAAGYELTLPRPVARARALIWLSIALGLPQLFVVLGDPNVTALVGLAYALAVAFTLVFAFAVPIALVTALGHGYGWPRWVFGAIIAYSVWARVELPRGPEPFWYAPLYIIDNAIDVVALLLLFSGRARVWFRNERDRRRS